MRASIRNAPPQADTASCPRSMNRPTHTAANTGISEKPPAISADPEHRQVEFDGPVGRGDAGQRNDRIDGHRVCHQRHEQADVQVMLWGSAQGSIRRGLWPDAAVCVHSACRVRPLTPAGCLVAAGRRANDGFWQRISGWPSRGPDMDRRTWRALGPPVAALRIAATPHRIERRQPTERR